jgi:hypothetical protein
MRRTRSLFWLCHSRTVDTTPPRGSWSWRCDGGWGLGWFGCFGKGGCRCDGVIFGLGRWWVGGE